MLYNKEVVIKCPYCGYEYLPGEIYLPKYFLGQPKEIERLVDGRIDVEFGIPQDNSEHYICDKCNKPFNVMAKISFETTKDTTKDFSEDYTMPLYTDRIELKEF